MSSTHRATLALILALSAWAGPSAAKTDTPDVDPVGLATLLLKDGHVDRAASVLDEVDLSDESIDKAQFYRLRGLVEVQRGRFGPAAGFLTQATNNGDLDPQTFLLLAQCLLQSDQAQAAADALTRAPAEVWLLPEAHLIKAQSMIRLGRDADAHAALAQGHERFPEHAEIERQLIYLLMRLGLFQDALESMSRFVRGHDPKPDDYIAFTESMIKGGELERAIVMLEAATLRFPEERAVRSQLAYAYLEAGRPSSAAEVLRPLTLIDSEVAEQAAEAYRRGRKLERAIRMNTRVADQKRKIRQRLALLIEMERYEEAAGLEARLARLGLLAEEPVTYALAYAFFQTGGFESAKRLLSKIEDPDLFRQGVALRRAMQTCEESLWQCER